MKRPLILPIGLLAILGVASTADDPSPDALIKAGHFKRARIIVEPKYKANPNDAELNYLISQIEDAFGNLDRARALAEKAVALDGKQARYHRQLGETYGETAEVASLFAKGGWAKKFKSEVDTAAALDPKDIGSRFDLLEYYLQAPRLMGGGKDKAAAMADEIARIDAVQGALAQARLAQDRKDPAAQESWYLKAAAANPVNYDALTTLAGFYQAATPPKADLAEKYAREAIKSDPGRAAGYSSLASALASQGRWNDLENCLGEATKNVPDDLAPYYYAGRAILTKYAAAPDPPNNLDLHRAEDYFRKYLSADAEGGEPAAAHAHWRLGLVFEKEGRRPEAISELETALRLKPDLAGARKDLKRLE
jgi:tetratricopeptide (TPR) repeat protein